MFAAKFERASWLSPNGKSVLIFRLLAREVSTLGSSKDDMKKIAWLTLLFAFAVGLHAAADETETDSRRSLEAAQRLSHQLHAAQDRIAELEAEVRLYREKAERAEVWLSRISNEIEDRLSDEPEEKQRLH